MHDVFSYPILFLLFSQNDICDANKNYFGKTIQDRELKFSPVILWNVPGAMSYFGCHLDALF